MKTLRFLTAILLIATTPVFASELSSYCETASGHLGNPDFGDNNGRIYLTIERTDEAEMSVTVAPQVEGKYFDYISVTVSGGETYTLGENENGDTLTDFTVVIPFDLESLPDSVTFSSIKWSNVASYEAGYWSVSSISVPFDISCTIDYNDDVAPEMVSAEVIDSIGSAITFYLEASDVDNDGEATTITQYLFTDVENGITNTLVEVDENGEATFTGLTPATTYNFTIQAIDLAGNISEGLELVCATAELYMIADFEDGVKSDSWVGEEGSDWLEVVANPYVDESNSSAYVLKGGRATDANFWAAAMLYDLEIAGGEYKYLHVMMHRNTVAGLPAVKLSDSTSVVVLFYPITGQQTMVANEWQDVVYDISSVFVEGTTIDFLYHYYDNGTLTEDVVTYFDNILLSNDMTPRVSCSSNKELTATAESSVYGVNGTIYVKSVEPTSVAVYSITGSCVALSKAVESAEYALPSGCYLVKVGNKVTKVII